MTLRVVITLLAATSGRADMLLWNAVDILHGETNSRLLVGWLKSIPVTFEAFSLGKTFDTQPLG